MRQQSLSSLSAWLVTECQSSAGFQESKRLLAECRQTGVMLLLLLLVVEKGCSRKGRLNVSRGRRARAGV
jgi:hypothetical protein